MSKDRNSELMRQMGSKTGAWDPEPPDQNLYELRHGCPQARLIAWVKSCTTGYGRNSPFAVDEKGKALHIEEAAIEIGWKLGHAKNELTEAIKTGRVRLDRYRRIWLCADVPNARIPTTDVGAPSPVQVIWPTYVVDFIESLPNEKRAKAKATYQRYWDWRTMFFADGIAALRSTDEQVEGTALELIGASKKAGAKKARPPKVKLKIELVELPSFVQVTEESPVQGTPVTPYNAKSSPVQETPIITGFTDRTDLRESVSPSSAADDRPTHPHPLEPIAELLTEELAASCPGEVPSEGLCTFIAGALGDAPLQYLRDAIQKKLAKNPRYFTSLGGALPLAHDALRVWQQAVKLWLKIARNKHGFHDEEAFARAVLASEGYPWDLKYWAERRISKAKGANI